MSFRGLCFVWDTGTTCYGGDYVVIFVCVLALLNIWAITTELRRV